jgi:hypothetical protein
MVLGKEVMQSHDLVLLTDGTKPENIICAFIDFALPNIAIALVFLYHL